MFRQTILLENSRRSWCLFCDRDPQFSPNLSNICFFLIRGAGKSKRRLIFYISQEQLDQSKIRPLVGEVTAGELWNAPIVASF
ncbi:hypothetical protein I7I48_08001 [Histoplasma ohiense]|nr:hypothetical protein I7I48_08001 [Histoplasma ohiense (nom. inval.)]